MSFKKLQSRFGQPWAKQIHWSGPSERWREVVLPQSLRCPLAFLSRCRRSTRRPRKTATNPSWYTTTAVRTIGCWCLPATPACSSSVVPTHGFVTAHTAAAHLSLPSCSACACHWATLTRRLCTGSCPASSRPRTRSCSQPLLMPASCVACVPTLSWWSATLKLPSTMQCGHHSAPVQEFRYSTFDLITN